jgi:flagellin-like protein
MRKAQYEIFGVVIIIAVLIVVGIFIFATNIKGNDVKSSVFSDISQDLLDASMNSNTDLSFTLEEVFSNCFDEKRNNLCKLKWDGDCCEYGQQSMQNILDATLDTWKFRYNLLITDGTKELEFTNDNRCKSTSQKSSPGFYLIPQSVIVAELFICK